MWKDPGLPRLKDYVGQMIDEAFREAKDRVILASFASNVYRLQQAITSAVKTNRKVAVVGRSMVNIVGDCRRAGVSGYS